MPCAVDATVLKTAQTLSSRTAAWSTAGCVSSNVTVTCAALPLGMPGFSAVWRQIRRQKAPREAISFAAELRRLRLQAGLTREMLAKRAGLGVATLAAL
jgi:hypothetical protein